MRVTVVLVRRTAIFLLAVVLAGCTSGGTTDQVQRLDAPLPALTGTDLQGHPLSSADLIGSVLVVNAWASWCGPCEQETPMLAELSRRYAAQGVRFVGIDHTDQLAEAKRFVDRFDVPYPSFADQAGRFAALLGYPGLPATYVVDASGTMRFAVFDRIEEGTLVGLLDEVLGEQPSPSG